MNNQTLEALQATKSRMVNALETDKHLEETEKIGIRKMLAILDALINAYTS